MSEQLSFTVPPDCDGMAAKTFLRWRCGISTRMITRLKREKDGILMDGKNLRTVDPISSGSVITVTLPEEEMSIEPVKGALNIVFEDAHLLALNKPPFMPVHPVKQHQTDTLANRVAYYAAQRGEDYVFRAQNRLDRNTSGLVLVCKDRFCINKLKGAVEKTYLALVHGRVEQQGTVDLPIALRDGSKIVRCTSPDGKPAVTHYRPLSVFDDISLIELKLETGRTHQIRCHMSSIGHPLLGDDLYGGSPELISRQALHCAEMRFVHPVTGETVSLNVMMPDDMQAVIDISNKE